jgi:hypothetical protein
MASLFTNVTRPPTAMVTSLGLTPLAVIVTVAGGAGAEGAVGAAGEPEPEDEPHAAVINAITPTEIAFRPL